MFLVASSEEYRFSLLKVSPNASQRAPLLSNRFHKSNLLVSRAKNRYSWSPLAPTPLCACRRTEGGAGAAPGRRSTVPCSGPLQPPPPGRRGAAQASDRRVAGLCRAGRRTTPVEPRPRPDARCRRRPPSRSQARAGGGAGEEYGHGRGSRSRGSRTAGGPASLRGTLSGGRGEAQRFRFRSGSVFAGAVTGVYMRDRLSMDARWARPAPGQGPCLRYSPAR